MGLVSQLGDLPTHLLPQPRFRVLQEPSRCPVDIAERGSSSPLPEAEANSDGLIPLRSEERLCQPSSISRPGDGAHNDMQAETSSLQGSEIPLHLLPWVPESQASPARGLRARSASEGIGLDPMPPRRLQLSLAAHLLPVQQPGPRGTGTHLHTAQRGAVGVDASLWWERGRSSVGHGLWPSSRARNTSCLWRSNPTPAAPCGQQGVASLGLPVPLPQLEAENPDCRSVS